MLELYMWLCERLEDERGQTMAEYAVVLAVITIAAIVALGQLSSGISGALNSITGTLSLAAVAVYVLLRLPGLAPSLVIISALVVGYSVGTGTQTSTSCSRMAGKFSCVRTRSRGFCAGFAATTEFMCYSVGEASSASAARGGSCPSCGR